MSSQQESANQLVVRDVSPETLTVLGPSPLTVSIHICNGYDQGMVSLPAPDCSSLVEILTFVSDLLYQIPVPLVIIAINFPGRFEVLNAHHLQNDRRALLRVNGYINDELVVWRDVTGPTFVYCGGLTEITHLRVV